ncbi:hypothetical protein BN903_29 [Halorubrum sp. AJ67]|nr:hypothetical protein BN903_29 [Halorubrum sp. AJ67]
MFSVDMYATTQSQLADDRAAARSTGVLLPYRAQNQVAVGSLIQRFRAGSQHSPFAVMLFLSHFFINSSLA